MQSFSCTWLMMRILKWLFRAYKNVKNAKNYIILAFLNFMELPEIEVKVKVTIIQEECDERSMNGLE